MSNTDPGCPSDPAAFEGMGTGVADPASAEHLQRLLDKIADHLATVEKRNTAALREMEERLEQLTARPDDLRAGQRPGSAQALERIAEGIELVAQHMGAGRIDAAPAAPMPLRYAGREAASGWGGTESDRLWSGKAVDPFDFVETGGSAPHQEHPAGRHEARLLPAYGQAGSGSGESENEARRAEAAGHAPLGSARSAGDAGEERAWLEDRLAQIAQRIEQSLLEMRPEATFMALGQRIEEFEHRVSSALEDVAKRADVHGLWQVEAHVTQLSGQLLDAHAKLERLAAIEAHLQTVAGRLSEECIAGLKEQAARTTPSMEEVAAAAVERASERFAAVHPDTAGRLDELQETLRRFAYERREAEARTANILDTMQQAMIRVLDRIDALEGALRPPQAAPAPVVTAAAPAVFPESAGQAPNGGRSGAPDAHRAAPGEAKTLEPPLGVPAGEEPPRASTGGPEPQPVRDVQRSLERVRQELVADAKRAKLSAAGQAAMQAKGMPRLDPAEASARLGPARPRQDQGARILGLPVKRLLAGLVVLLILIQGVSVLIGRRSGGGAQPAAPASGEMSPDKGSAKGAALPAPAGRETKTRLSGESERSEAAAASLPPGVTVHQAASVPANLDRLIQQQRMADMSARLGVAVAQASPAGLRPNGSESSEPQEEAAIAAASGEAGTRGPLALPAATVGPLSLRLAAAHGDPSAQFEVASRLAEGKGTDQNLEEAVAWYQRAASAGLAIAQYRLATFFERGLGVKADRARARIWYGRAAEQGNIKAMHNLAVLSADQQSTSPDYATAVYWFTKAAEYGLPDSQYNLAVLYESGLGTGKDLVQAYRWYALAAQSGDNDAVRRREEVRRQLGAQELAAAEEALRSFSPKRPDPLANEPLVAGQAWKQNQSAQAN